MRRPVKDRHKRSKYNRKASQERGIKYVRVLFLSYKWIFLMAQLYYVTMLTILNVTGLKTTRWSGFNMTLNKNPCLLFLFCFSQEPGRCIIFTRTACIANANSPSPLLTSLRDHVRLREQACLQCATLFARTRR